MSRQILQLKPGELSLDDLLTIHRGGARIDIDPAAWSDVHRSAAVVQAAAAGDAAVYGVNTGFGKLASTRIGAEDLATLQRNLIRSHSVGVGEPLAAPVVRLMLALKAASLARWLSASGSAVGLFRPAASALAALGRSRHPLPRFARQDRFR